MVNLYTTNKIQPPIRVLCQIAEFLNIDVWELLIPNKISDFWTGDKYSFLSNIIIILQVNMMIPNWY